MILPIFWRRLANIAGALRAQFMFEIERNPLALRQGAAAVACIAAAAVAMPVIADRAAEQREGAEWAARSEAFQIELAEQLARSTDPDARIELTAHRTAGGQGARGSGSLFADLGGAHAMLVEAALRGPNAPRSARSAVEVRQVNQRELRCMSEAIYYEARSESYEGQVAVAEVVMNRVKSRHYPSSVCSVVYQGSHRLTGCQFTFTCDGALNRQPRGRAWERAQHIADLVMHGEVRAVTNNATHYHTTAINPVWSSGLVRTTAVGSHVFYRFPNRSEAATYRTALANRRSANAASRAAAAESAPEPVEQLIPEAGIAALQARGATRPGAQAAQPGDATAAMRADPAAPVAVAPPGVAPVKPAEAETDSAEEVTASAAPETGGATPIAALTAPVADAGV